MRRSLVLVPYVFVTIMASRPGVIHAQKALAAACMRPTFLEAKMKTRATADLYAQSGAWFEEHHRPECAARDYAAAVGLRPNSSQLYFRLGNSLLSAGEATPAEKALRESIRLGPETAEQHEKLAQSLEQLGLRDEGKAEWSAALRINPRSANALDGLAKRLIAEGNYPAAINLLQDASMDNESLVLDLIQAYGRGGSLPNAGATAEKALQKHPESFPITYTLTTILVDEGKLREATRLSESYVRAHPTNLEARRLFLRLLITTSDSERARPLAKRLLAEHPTDAYFLYVNGKLELEAGKIAQAKVHMEKSVQLDPSSPDARYQLGLALMKLNQPEGARAEFEKVIKLGPAEPEVYFQLSKALRALGKQGEAEQQLQLYRDLADAQSKRAIAQGKAALADRELEGGNVKTAVVLLQDALRATPNDALLNFKLAMAFDKSGDTASETAALEKALDIDRDMAIAHNQLGYLASRAGDIDSAEQHYREAVRAAPSYAEAWINLAATLAMESKFPEALQAIAKALQVDPGNKDARQLQQQLQAEH